MRFISRPCGVFEDVRISVGETQIGFVRPRTESGIYSKADAATLRRNSHRRRNGVVPRVVVLEPREGSLRSPIKRPPVISRLVADLRLSVALDLRSSDSDAPIVGR